MRLRLCSILSLLLPVLAQTEQQVVMENTVQQQHPTIADLLTLESSASIFYGYARELKLSTTFSDADAKLTVLSPTNKAVMALARKPHQDPVPDDDGVIVTEEEFDARSKENIQRWVSSHIIPQSPIQFDDQTYETLLDEKTLTFSLQKGNSGPTDWSKALLNGDVHIVGKREAVNGVIYLIDGTVTLD
ncbi:FAS1 domain-containing protein [Mycena kentingensis (nom. inval.)]|nr:FAS1 domain-containing protein [Mycena kentingensis (nom. inval.)]